MLIHPESTIRFPWNIEHLADLMWHLYLNRNSAQENCVYPKIDILCLSKGIALNALVYEQCNAIIIIMYHFNNECEEVQIVKRLFLMNYYVLHVPRLPSQPASNVGG